MKPWLKRQPPQQPLNTPDDLAKLGVLAVQAAETLRILNREVAAVTLWIEAEMGARLPRLAALTEQFHGCVEDYLALATRFNVADPAQVREQIAVYRGMVELLKQLQAEFGERGREFAALATSEE